jgi:hypothetical protein
MMEEFIARVILQDGGTRIEKLKARSIEKARAMFLEMGFVGIQWIV